VRSHATQDWNDGYDRAVLGLVEYAAKPNKLMAQHLAKSGAEGVKFLREFHLAGRISRSETRRPGGFADELAEGRRGRDRHEQGRVSVGVVKRHYSGAAIRLTAQCSIVRLDRSAVRVVASSRKRRWQQTGTDQVTVRNLEIVSVDADDNVIAGEGAIPDRNGERDGSPGETVTDERASRNEDAM